MSLPHGGEGGVRGGWLESDGKERGVKKKERRERKED